MSVEGPLSPANPPPLGMSATRLGRLTRARSMRGMLAACGGPAILLAAVCACGSARRDSYELRSVASPTGRGSAQVRVAPCGSDSCESLWLGPAADDVRQLTMLSKGQHCDEVAWQADGSRVGFLVDGYQLRMYDARTRTPAGQINLVDPDGPPTTRIARGLTFSTTGSAITFDDCPRGRSGCRPGMVAIR
jgi:hypothetical protein